MTAPGAEPAQPGSGPILLVTNDPIAGALLEQTLSRSGHEVWLTANAAAAADAMTRALPVLVVLDLVLPDADGRELLSGWRSAAATSDVPVIVLTGAGFDPIHGELLALGASRCLPKPVDEAALAEALAQLPPTREIGDPGTDRPTGLAGRAALCRAYRELVDASPGGGAVAVALMDIDRFRAVIETCGGRTADGVLRGVADLLRTSVAPGQVVGRWQGDRFMALLPGVTQEAASGWLERLLDALRQHAFTSEHGGLFYVTFSAGVGEAKAGVPIDDAIAAVQAHLYAAKRAGRARVVGSATEPEPRGATVLVVDADPTVSDLVRSVLEPRGLVVAQAVDTELAVEAAQNKKIDLVLVGVSGSGGGGFQLLERLRGMPQYAKVPIAALCATGDDEALARAFALGADDYLTKPLSAARVLSRTDRLLSRWVEGRLHELQGSTVYLRGMELLRRVFSKVSANEPIPVQDLSSLTLRIVRDLKEHPAKLLGQVMNPAVADDDFLVQHSLNSAILATIVGEEVGFEGDDLDWLCLAALLHEVGCVRLPDGLLSTTAELDEEQKALIRRRPELSSEIIRALAPDYAAAADIAVQVHERPDGSGYPRGLSGDEISLEAQILGAVEVFEALTHHRPYRENPQAASEAVNFLLDSRHTQFLDRVLKALISKVGLYPVGSYVELGTGDVARVLEHRQDNPMRPMLAIIQDGSGTRLASPRVADPLLDPRIHITSSVMAP